MIKSCVVGASGYTGAELASLLNKHPEFSLEALYVSANSQDAGKSLQSLHGKFAGLVDLPLQPLPDDQLTLLAEKMDIIFLATPHEASHDWMPRLCNHKAVIVDLSGAFRIKNAPIFEQYYGFPHNHNELLEAAVYGLADWYSELIGSANLIAVPGCYPTASLSALKPLQQANLLDEMTRPVINAVSGVSGAGRKAALNSSFCEVSLQSYGVLGHRHQPEISAYLGTDVIFTPHMGNFKRGILATITVKVKNDVTNEQVDEAFKVAYANNPIVRLLDNWPKLDDVVNTPYCDLHWKLDQSSGYLVVSSAIDNLLKGAASQALQCANLRFGFASHLGLHSGAHD